MLGASRPEIILRENDLVEILKESLDHEEAQLKNLYNLLKLVEGDSVYLEEYAREMIVQEELHLDEVDKMLRRPGEIGSFQQ